MIGPSGAKPVSFLKGLVLFYLIFLVVFFAAAPFLAFLLYWETDLTTSILPELIGFCLQGGFLVLIFALYEQRSALNARRNQKLVLRTFLGSLVKRSLMALPGMEPGELKGEGFFGREREILESSSLDAAQLQELRRVVITELTSLESLASVAAQIDYAHLQIWIGLADQVRMVRDALDGETARQALIVFLDRIGEFDESPLG